MSDVKPVRCETTTYTVDDNGLFCRHCGRAAWHHYTRERWCGRYSSTHTPETTNG